MLCNVLHSNPSLHYRREIDNSDTILLVHKVFTNSYCQKKTMGNHDCSHYHNACLTETKHKIQT